MSVKISELPILDSLADNDILAGVDVSGNTTSKIELGTLKNYIDTNTQYTAGTNIDITNNVVSAPNVYNKDEMDNQIEELQSEVDSLSTIFNAFPTESGEGESLTLDDTAEVKFKKFDLKGNTSQTGTPTPSSPIPVNVVSGDNEIEVQNANLWSSEWEQGIIDGTTGGNATNNDCIRTKDYIPVIPNQHYAIKRNIYNLYTNIRGYDKNKNFIGTGSSVIDYISGASSANNPMNNNVSSCVIAPKNNVYYVRWNDFSNNLTTQYMMIKGDTIPTNYVPYEIDTYNIDLPVENLFDKDTTNILIGYISTTGFNSYANNRVIYIPTKVGQTYTIQKTVGSGNLLYAFTENTPAIGTQTLLGRTEAGSKTETVTAPTNGNYLAITIYRDADSSFTVDDVLGGLQIEKGTKANTYTPFGTTPIELCKIGNYQDYFYKDSDKWYLHKEIGKVVLDGAEAGWGKTGYTLTNDRIYTGKPLSLCSHFTNAGDNWSSSNESYRGKYSTTNTNDILKCMPLTDMTTTQFKDWLSTNNVSLYYALSTPTSTQITYQPLIDQLNLLEQAQSKENQTNISQVNNDLGFIIYAEAIKSLENVLDRLALVEE